jgi:hypothetical protein
MTLLEALRPVLDEVKVNPYADTTVIKEDPIIAYSEEISSRYY